MRVADCVHKVEQFNKGDFSRKSICDFFPLFLSIFVLPSQKVALKFNPLVESENAYFCLFRVSAIVSFCKAEAEITEKNIKKVVS